VLPGRGDGTFQTQETFGAGESLLTSLVARDFNGDGRTDLAVANWYSFVVSVFLADGDGTFQDQVTCNTSEYSPFSLALGDFNGDGRADLSVGHVYY
jgi:hypothetical protein